MKKRFSIKYSIAITTLIISIWTSISTNYFNISEFSFLIILIVLSLIFYFSYKIFDFISNHSLIISSIIILIIIKKTFLSSIPTVPFFILFILFITTLHNILLKSYFKAIICSLILIPSLIGLFFEKNIEIEKSNEVFQKNNGKIEYNLFTYGSGDDKRKEYNNPKIISPFLDVKEILNVDWNQSKFKWRKKFWGFSKDKIPINGKIWLPKEKNKVPLVLIIHGNHDMQDFSENGYDYLGEFLSSYGIGFVSIDQNFLNGSWEGDFRGKEMTTRAVHLLETICFLKTQNTNEKSILFDKIDFNKIIIAGHSRGGEAVNIAAKFNKLSSLPENGNFKFNYNHKIEGIITIAPTDYRYSRNYQLNNLNYMSIHGSMDSDEESFFGLRQSNRLNIKNKNMKVNILIEGANHSQFNSSWGTSDVGFPSKYLIKRSKILPDWYQRNILKYYMFNFINAAFYKNEISKQKLKKSFSYKISEKKELKILSNFQDGSINNIIDFEQDDIFLNKISEISGDHIKEFSSEDLNFRGGKKQQNKVLKIKTDSLSTLKIKLLNENKIKFKNLYLNISNQESSSLMKIKYYNLENKIIGQNELKLINSKIDLRNYKFDFLTINRFKKMNDINFYTVSIKIPNLEVDNFEISFSKKGIYYLDNIYFK